MSSIDSISLSIAMALEMESSNHWTIKWGCEQFNPQVAAKKKKRNVNSSENEPLWEGQLAFWWWWYVVNIWANWELYSQIVNDIVRQYNNDIQ